MSLVTGNYFDLATYSMGNWQSIVTFELNAPATQQWDEKRLISSARKHSTTVNLTTGEWVMPIASTESMGEDRWYTVTGTSLDEELGMPRLDIFPWKIRIPEGNWKFTDLVRDWSSPLAVGISTVPPDLLPAWWLHPVTGDFSRKTA